MAQYHVRRVAVNSNINLGNNCIGNLDGTIDWGSKSNNLNYSSQIQNETTTKIIVVPNSLDYVEGNVTYLKKQNNAGAWLKIDNRKPWCSIKIVVGSKTISYSQGPVFVKQTKNINNEIKFIGPRPDEISIPESVQCANNELQRIFNASSHINHF